MSGVQRPLRKRLTALVLAFALLLGLVPAVELGGTAEAAYADSYVQQMVDWGFMRGDIEGNLRPNDPITRAEFVTIVNRAFGYETMNGYPFTDVDVRDWYSDDVDISYTEGYIAGTSETTFSPEASITREEAAVILARNLMLQPTVGEDTSFSDSRELDEWSRGYVATAARYQLLTGYDDGSFRPKNPITRGEAAILMTRAIGTPVQEAGVHELGYTWGNVTITESGATLRNTVVGGNLYITAGVDLGSVTLENVRVLGEIVISGGGLSEGGDDSIVLRNVDAPTLIVDNIGNQQVSLRVEGNGIIDSTSVRTDAFITDNTQAGYGLSHIELDGEPDELSLHLSGNVKEVVNKTPGSALSVDSGRVETITVDETATGSTLHIAAGAEVENVNLDVGTEVTGEGDIGHLTVNAPGSTVTMLPDQITIRPGIEADIAGETMDSVAAAESSADPRLLSGYPSVTDLAPTTATARFSANKRGTVHWAVTSVTDGSATVDELLNPPAYTNKIVQNGTLSLGGSEEVGTAALRGLTSDGSYYLAAVLVDARGEQSPMKVISFSTPDDSVPDFADGYPYLSQITNISAQVTVMATKTCRLYWAVLPDGAAAPTAEDFKANAVSGNLGFGTLDLTKNVEATFDANNVPLEELEDYVVYLWLTDVDGGQSSRVESLDFTTVDRTPPIFNTEATVNEVERNSVGLYANLNEDGTLYWVVVEEGEEYPKPLAGQSGDVPLNSDTAKLQVANGMNCLDSGSVRMREGQDVDFRVTGLDPEKAYDLYYVAQDEAGNYSATVIKITIHTADPNAPTVTQEFDNPSPSDPSIPYADTGVILVFSETVQDDETNQDIAALYDQISVATGDEKAELQQRLTEILSQNITLYYHSNVGRPEAVGTDTTADHWINYDEAVVENRDGRTYITFPYNEGIKLLSGATYHFEVRGFADMSTEKNVMSPAILDEFTTLFAQISITDGSSAPDTITRGQVNVGEDVVDQDGYLDDIFGEDNNSVPVDFYWQLEPLSASQVDDNIKWDMILWSDTRITFQLFRRGPGDNGNWTYLGETEVPITANTPTLGISMQMDIVDPTTNNPAFPNLNRLEDEQIYEYAVSITSVQDSTNRDTWSQNVTMQINTVAGRNNPLGLLGNSITETTWDNLVGAGKDVLNIGVPDDKSLTKPFRDQEAPHFISGYPNITVGDSMAQVDVMLDRTGTVFWMVAKRNDMNTIGTDGKDYGKVDTANPDQSEPGLPYGDLPESGTEDGLDNDTGEVIDGGEFGETFIEMSEPSNSMIYDPSWVTNDNIQYGSTTASNASTPIHIEDLDANQDYIIYFVIQGTANVFSEVLCYRFTTGDVTPAYITLDTLSNPEVGMRVSQDASELYYALYVASELPSITINGSLVQINDPSALLMNVLSSELSDSEKAYFDQNYAAYTILTALLTNYRSSSDGESVFDHYASSDAKEELYDILSAQGSNGAQDSGTLTNMTAGNRELVDFEDAMDPNSITPYICIATAQNRLGGEWAFKAINGVRIPDNQAPYLESVNSFGEEGQFDGFYSGTLTLTFNEPLYYTDGEEKNNSLVNVWGVVCTNDQPTTGKTLTGLIPTLGLGTRSTYAKLTYSGGSTTTPTYTYNLRFSDFQIGDTISIPGTGYYTDPQQNTDDSKRYVLRLEKIGEDHPLIDNFEGNGVQFVLIQGTLGP